MSVIALGIMAVSYSPSHTTNGTHSRISYGAHYKDIYVLIHIGTNKAEITSNKTLMFQLDSSDACHDSRKKNLSWFFLINRTQNTPNYLNIYNWY